MKRKQKWVYYCDFCKKSGRSAGSMAKHEKHCTMNPARVCRMCKDYGDGTPQAEMSDMLEALKVAEIKEEEDWLDNGYGDVVSLVNIVIEHEKEAIERLKEVANGCPMCMLAAIRQTTKYPLAFGSFNFNLEKAKFWQSANDVGLILYRG